MPAGTCPTTMRNDCKSKNRGKPKEAETLWYKRAAAGQESFNEPIMRALSLSLSLYFVLFFYLSLYLSFPLSLSLSLSRQTHVHFLNLHYAFTGISLAPAVRRSCGGGKMRRKPP